MATLSTNLLLVDLTTGESAFGAHANWGAVTDSNFAFLEDTVSEVTSKTLSSSNVTLSDDEERSLLIKLTGVLSANVNVNTNDRKGFWFVRNNTTGAFTVTFKTVSGTGVVVPQGGSLVLVSDGTNISAMSAAGSTPIGSMMDYAGLTAPTFWLLCFGQAISRTTYAGLFAVISTTYGVGNGSTTFNLPDLRGRVVAGQDDMGGVSANRLTTPINGDTLGAAGGDEDVVLTTANLAAHTHTFSDTATTGTGSANHTHSATGSGVIGALQTIVQGGAANGSVLNVDGASGSAHTHSVTVSGTTSSTGSGTAHTNVQPTIILNKIIYAGA